MIKTHDPAGAVAAPIASLSQIGRPGIGSRNRFGSWALLLAAVLLFLLAACAWWALPFVAASKKVVIKVPANGRNHFTRRRDDALVSY